jgi:N-ethylmaleimide reductase
MPSLFEPVMFGAIQAPNRILMAPLTRARNTHDHVPTPLMAEYYRQRATAGLIISEATGISLEGLGWPYGPGIWSPEQIEGWKRVTDAFRSAGGRMICQLWHMAGSSTRVCPAAASPSRPPPPLPRVWPTPTMESSLHTSAGIASRRNPCDS